MNKNCNISQVIAYQHNPDKECYEKLVHAGNKCIRIHNKRKHPVGNFIDTIKIIKIEKPDIIHAHMSLLNFLPLFCGLLCGVKIRISHSHIANKNIGSDFAEKLFKFLNILFATKLLACGYNAGKYMYGNKKFTVIYNSISLNEFLFSEDSRRSIRNMLCVDSDEILLGSVGRLTEQKNQLFLINVMKKLVDVKPKYKLIILGNGELQNDLEDLVKRYHLENNVIIHSSVVNINEFYDAMDVFVLPSLYEGFPVSLVEAQASGLNCLVSDTVDRTAKINGTVEFLNNKNVDLWMRTILKQNIKNRTIDVNKFNDFDVNYSYMNLYDFYKNSVSKQ